MADRIAGWALESWVGVEKRGHDVKAQSANNIATHPKARQKLARNGGQSSSFPIRAERDSGEKMVEFVRNTSRSG